MEMWENNLERQLLSLGILAALTWALAWRNGFCKWTCNTGPDKNRGVTPGSVLAVVLLYYIASVLIYPTLVLGHRWYNEYHIGRDTPVNQESVLLLSFAWIQFACVSWYVRRTPSGLPKRIWWRNESIRSQGVLKQLGFGLLSWPMAFMTVMFLVTLLRWIILPYLSEPPMEQTAVDMLRGSKDDMFRFLLGCFTVSVPIPMSEELLFRGVIQTCFRRYFGVFGAITGASVIFALAHVSIEQGPANAEVFLGIFALSWLLGFIYERQGSLWAPIALHGAHNMTMSVLIWFGPSPA